MSDWMVKKNAMKNCVSIYLLLLTISIHSCVQDPLIYDGPGKKPIYLPLTQLGEIYNTAPQPVSNSGPIYYRDSLFFMTELKKGIHVFNVKDTANPIALTFIKIPAVNDFTLSGNKLYADNWTNLVTIDISDINNISVLNTQPNVFQPIYFPTLYRGYFECANEKNGAIVDWIDTELTGAKCQTNN